MITITWIAYVRKGEMLKIYLSFSYKHKKTKQNKIEKQNKHGFEHKLKVKCMSPSDINKWLSEFKRGRVKSSLEKISK